MTQRIFRGACALGLAALGLGLGRSAPAQNADAVFSEQAGADRAAAASQARIDQLQDATQDMLGKYRQALLDTESFKKYNEQLAVQVRAQAERINSMRKELSDIEATKRDVLPLMQKMVDTLEKFVALDLPFFPEERARRVATMKGLLTAADVSDSEKFRRILEAYQIEMDYGRSVDSYEGTIGQGDQKKTVQFVRVGRVVLLYQTLDGSETGYWDASKKSWTEDDDYARDVRHALRVAKKLGAPDLLMIPVPAPKESKS